METRQWRERKTIISQTGEGILIKGVKANRQWRERAVFRATGIWFGCSLCFLCNDDCEYKNENYACVRVILTAATSPLALDWNDWFCLWEKLPVCPGFRAVMCETQLFPWLGKGEQPAEPGFLTPPSPLIFRNNYHTPPNCDFWDLHCLMSFFQQEDFWGGIKWQQKCTFKFNSFEPAYCT